LGLGSHLLPGSPEGLVHGLLDDGLPRVIPFLVVFVASMPRARALCVSSSLSGVPGSLAGVPARVSTRVP
jgi:hypothetical protein